MARKKTETQQMDFDSMEKGSEDLTQKLGEAFETVIMRDYGHLRAPDPTCGCITRWWYYFI
jgi:hypothetical protein